MPRYFTFFLLYALLSTACDGPVPETDRKTYYDLRSFIEKQIVLLDSLQPMVQKVVANDGQREQRQVSKLDWHKELELFLQADINKPAFRNSYAETKDGNALTYRLKDGETEPIQSLKVTLNEQGLPREVEVTVLSTNYLYDSVRRLRLVCGPDGLGRWRVQSYHVDGHQKPIFLDKETFAVHGQVL